jgi:eukaryotic-like serine/threonine-protein kinase
MSDRSQNPPTPIALKSGDRLGAYRIERAIGSGGMAEVYYAIHEGLRRPAAIKVLRASLATDDVHLQRFMQEARAAASLIHPNIVQVYDVGQEGEHRYIAQEYIPGTNLRQYLTDNGQMSINVALSVLLQVLAALSKSAAVGIVHRDIKPENIMLTKDGDVKVADYGLARVLLSDDPQLTRAGTTLGTPMYMSPEQIQEGNVDIRSDLYSLGVTLFHMLAGRPPFTGETPLALAMQHVQAEPPNILELREDLPQTLVQLISKLLAKEPEHRFASPNEVLEVLRSARSTELEAYWPDQTVPLPGAMNSSLQGPSAATLMLQSKLMAQRLAARKRLRYVIAAPVCAALAFWLGSLLGELGRAELLDSKEPAFQGIKQLGTVKEQFADALLSNDNSSERWEAVINFFPKNESLTNRIYTGKALLQLAVVYLQKRDFARARSMVDLVLRDEQMPPLLQTLAQLQLAEIEDVENRPRAKEAAIDQAKSLFKGEKMSNPDRELVGQWAESSTRSPWMRDLIDELQSVFD